MSEPFTGSPLTIGAGVGGPRLCSGAGRRNSSPSKITIQLGAPNMKSYLHFDVLGNIVSPKAKLGSALVGLWYDFDNLKIKISLV